MNKEELLQEIKLRRLVRKAIKIREAKNKLSEKKELTEEKKLRKIIRYLLREGDVRADTKPAPYESTPVNMLADAFNQILPVLKTGLRKLTKTEERQSYRIHVLEKLKSIFDNFDSLDLRDVGGGGAIGESDIVEQEEDENKIVFNLDDPDRIVPDIEKDRFKAKEKSPDDQEKEDFDNFAQPGTNPTGARVAFETFNDSNIETILSKKRQTLFDDEDKDQYKQFALYNADLWLLTYEEELSKELGQPPAYDTTIMPRPAGAKEAAPAEKFAPSPGAGEVADAAAGATMEAPEEEGEELPPPI
tara:strand:+ start:9115 stop:10023 length:909 start_codon:yes stop_codon:yes gene_type:complete